MPCHASKCAGRGFVTSRQERRCPGHAGITGHPGPVRALVLVSMETECYHGDQDTLCRGTAVQQLGTSHVHHLIYKLHPVMIQGLILVISIKGGEH